MPLKQKYWKIITVKVSILLCVAAIFMACGFHMRKPIELPADMKTVYLRGLPNSSRFARYLSESLRLSEGRIVRKLELASFLINVSSEQFGRREVSLSQSGKANEYELTYVLVFDLQTPKGETILAPQTIKIIRDYFNPQVNVIGKSEEEGLIRKEMHKEAARSLLRRAELALRSYRRK